MGRRGLSVLLGAMVLLAVMTHTAAAARIGDITTTDVFTQARRFFLLQDESVRWALLGSIFLGISCGLLGSFIVVRKLALMGDTLSHAVLPGVVLGFLWNMTKDPIAIFTGATVAGLLGAGFVSLITHTTRLKEDTALGLVLASFFAVGICLLTMVQHTGSGAQSGLDKFLFGQAAALGPADATLMAIVTGISALVLLVFYKEFLITSFDPGFAGTIGVPVRILHYVLMLLLAFAIVISLQAVGVVLVSAMLITPAAAAYLLTDRLNRMLIYAAVFGALAGASGAFFSFLGHGLPTGPFMVLSCSAIFAVSFLFAPRHGTVTRWWRHRSRVEKVNRENTLKTIYHVLEERDFEGDGVSLRELAERRRESEDEAAARVKALARHDCATLHEDGKLLFLTPEGWQRACAIVRNHRLWELYLATAAKFPVDHVHEDAEKIEHVLGEEIVRELERRLESPVRDPHGKRIPSVREIWQKGEPPGRAKIR